MEVVIDACTLVKGFSYSSGSEKQIIDYILNGKINVVVSQQAILEYIYAPYKIFVQAVDNGNPSSIKMALSMAHKISSKLSKLLSNHVRIEKVTSNVKFVIEDPADDKFINLCIQSGILYLVSNDTHITSLKDSLKKQHDIRVISPSELVMAIKFNKRL